MSDPNARFTVGMDVANDSLEHIRDEFLMRQGQNAKEFITGCYINGVNLWEDHLQGINEKIEEAGGIKKIKTFDRDFTNAIKCKDGTTILMSDLLKGDVVELELPEGAPTFGILETTQQAWAQMSFGGNHTFPVGPSAFSTTWDIHGLHYVAPEHIEDILAGEYRPTEIGLTEAVTTHSATEDMYTASGSRYMFMGRTWGAKLREEFAPDPATDPEAYAFWMATEPLPKLDVAFAASQKPARSGYKNGERELPSDERIHTYYSQTDIGGRFTVEGAEKMLRGSQLLDMFWQRVHGTPMPTPNAGSFTRHKTPKALPA